MRDMHSLGQWSNFLTIHSRYADSTGTVTDFSISLFTAPSLDDLVNRTNVALYNDVVVAPGVGYYHPVNQDLVYVWEVRIVGESEQHDYTLDVCDAALCFFCWCHQ
jgi:hypothetical protein